jgi:hypothetical protein
VRITQSILGQADKCMLAAQYTLDRPSWAVREGGAERAVGTGYHAGLERYYVLRSGTLGNDLVPDLVTMVGTACDVFDTSMTVDLYDNRPIEVFKWSERVPDRTAAHSLIEALLKAYTDGKHWWPSDWSVLETEASHTVLVDGFEYKLGADLVLQDPAGYIVLVDHKTAGKAWASNKHEPRKNDQASLYTALARHVWPDAPGHRFVFDIMRYPTKSSGPLFERRISDPDSRHEAAVLKKALDFRAVYEIVHVNNGRDLPANPASTLCNPKWCDFFAGCPFGAALE